MFKLPAVCWLQDVFTDCVSKLTGLHCHARPPSSAFVASAANDREGLLLQGWHFASFMGAQMAPAGRYPLRQYNLTAARHVSAKIYGTAS